jgi:ketosteroid isomerase-like protein
MQLLTDELFSSNQKFYQAFTALSEDEMQSLWMKTPYVKCLHPGWHIVAGYEAVMESWRMIFRSTGSMDVLLDDIEATVLGRVGIITLKEKLKSSNNDESQERRATLVATNLFELTDDGWKMILHQAGPSDE